MPDSPDAIALGIDIGTSGVRVAAINHTGHCLGVSGTRFADEAAAKNPQSWWQAVAMSIKALSESVSLQTLRAIAVDGTSGTLLGVDAAGRPVAPPSMYYDAVDDAVLRACLESIVPLDNAARGASSPLARAIVLSRQSGVAAIVHQADWIAGRLRGVFDATDANNALKTGGDPDKLCWPDWIESAGLDRRLLPKIHEAGRPLGRVGRAGVALGLPPAAVVHAGTTDGCASFLATGADQPGDAVTALGSTLVVKLLSTARVDAPQYGIYSHRIADGYLVGGASNTGGGVLLGLFGAERLAALTAQVQPDRSLGLDYYPLLRPGERFPESDPAFLPRLEPRPADDGQFFQAVLEGMTEIEATGYARLAELGATPVRSLRTVGGGAVNKAWTTMRQMRLGIPFARSLSEEACVGVATLGLRYSRLAVNETGSMDVSVEGMPI